MSTMLAEHPTAASRTRRSRPTGAHRRVEGPSFLGLELASELGTDGTVRRLHGLRRQGMVEIRFPGDDTESVTWLCVSTLPFRCLLGAADMPRVITQAIGDVPLVAPIWQGIEIRGTDIGLVAVRRRGSTMEHAFLHDLWLLERIAGRLGAPAVPVGDLSGEPVPGAMPADRTATGTTGFDHWSMTTLLPVVTAHPRPSLS